MNLFVAGISYKTTPVALREALAVHPSRLSCYGCRLRVSGDLSELVLISTCNRVEIYGVGPSSEQNVSRLFQLLSRAVVDVSSHLYIRRGEAAVRHLFSVASGLDSMVLGETEITGQVKQAYLAAQQAKLTGRVTNRLFQTALQVAKEIRTQTAIGRGATSVGSVAVELAERIFGQDLSRRNVLIIGAGKMGEACVRHLSKKGARSVLVANRSYERGLSLAAEFGGRAVPFSELLPSLAEADIVVSSTGSTDTILDREAVASVLPKRGGRPLFLIDIAVPRDIAAEVQQLDNVYLYNVDHLEEILHENIKCRELELSRCHEIIEERTAALLSRFQPAPEKKTQPGSEPWQPWAMSGAAACPG
jgi:glutamyl-tRNA reductase